MGEGDVGGWVGGEAARDGIDSVCLQLLFKTDIHQSLWK